MHFEKNDINSVYFLLFSKHRDFSSSASVGQTPTNILLFTIINAIHPVNVDTVKKISQQHAEVQRIVIFHKNGLQALVEFLTIDDAQNVQQALNGCDIFAGCCTLKIDFSKVYLQRRSHILIWWSKIKNRVFFQNNEKPFVYEHFL